jgi:hypothetical protein
MVCYMAQGSPFGHLRLDPSTKIPPPGPPPGTPPAPPPGTPPAPPPGTPRGIPRGIAHAPARARERAIPPGVSENEYNLPKSGSLEAELPRLLGLPEELVSWAIAHLESRQVFNRDAQGIIYCRRMVRWASEREARKRRALEAYKRSRSGNGNPGRNRPPGTPHAPPPGTPPGIPPGTPHGGARGTASAPPPGIPGAPPLSLALDKYPTPQPPPRKRGGGANTEHVAQLIRERSKHA